MKKLPTRDPEAAFVRRATAARCIGANAKCACGENRPEALIRGSKPVMCHECKRKEEGKTTVDEHHFAAAANSPVTMPASVNDHRAELSTAQYDWPKNTRENPDGSPFLAAAGCIRGFIDYILYLIEKGLHWVGDRRDAGSDLRCGRQPDYRFRTPPDRRGHPKPFG